MLQQFKFGYYQLFLFKTAILKPFAWNDYFTQYQTFLQRYSGIPKWYAMLYLEFNPF